MFRVSGYEETNIDDTPKSRFGSLQIKIIEQNVNRLDGDSRELSCLLSCLRELSCELSTSVSLTFFRRFCVYK